MGAMGMESAPVPVFGEVGRGSRGGALTGFPRPRPEGEAVGREPCKEPGTTVGDRSARSGRGGGVGCFGGARGGRLALIENDELLINVRVRKM